MLFFTKMIVAALFGLHLASGVCIAPSPGETQAPHPNKRDSHLQPRGLGFFAFIEGALTIAGAFQMLFTEARYVETKERLKKEEILQSIKDGLEYVRYTDVMEGLDQLGKDLVEVKAIVRATDRKVQQIQKAMNYFYGVESEFPGISIFGQAIIDSLPEGGDLVTWQQCIFDVLRGRWFGEIPITSDVDRMTPCDYSVLVKMPMGCLTTARQASTNDNEDSSMGIRVKDCVTNQYLDSWRHKDCIIIEGINEDEKNKLQDALGLMYSLLTDNFPSKNDPTDDDLSMQDLKDEYFPPLKDQYGHGWDHLEE